MTNLLVIILRWNEFGDGFSGLRCRLEGGGRLPSTIRRRGIHVVASAGERRQPDANKKHRVRRLRLRRGRRCRVLPERRANGGCPCSRRCIECSATGRDTQCGDERHSQTTTETMERGRKTENAERDSVRVPSYCLLRFPRTRPAIPTANQNARFTALSITSTLHRRTDNDNGGGDIRDDEDLAPCITRK